MAPRNRSASGSTRRQFLGAAAAAAVIGSQDGAAAAPRRARPKSAANSRARIVTICHADNGRRSVTGNRARMLELVDEAMKEKPDLICLPETFTSAWAGQSVAETAEPLDGPTVSAFGRKAKDGRCYIICPINTRERGSIYNSAIVLDRMGNVAGVYHKNCPVTTQPDYTQMEEGTMPGASIPVFDTDFGRIGIQICFDAGFPENWQALASKGVRAVFWPSAYEGGFPLKCYAYLHHYWVISATRTGTSRIIDPVGDVLAETAAGRPIAARDVNLDYVVGHLDFNYSVEEKIRKTYGDRVEYRMWDPGSGHFIVEPKDPSVRTEEIMRTVGLEPTSLYHQRHRDAYKRLRKGEKALPQTALHGKRPQYGK